MRNVLYFQSAQRQSNLAQLAGVRRFAQDARWRVNVVEYASSADDTGVGGRGKPDVKRLLEFWRPDGVIVACGAAPDMFKMKDFRGTAVTFLDGEHRLVGKDAVCIVTDDRLIAEVAAKELLRRDCRALAWVDWVKPIDWSERRGRAFREFARLNGKPCLEFVPPRKATAESWFAWKLEEWLRKLPKPCGIMAANDYLATCVLQACRAAAIPVPDDWFDFKQRVALLDCSAATGSIPENVRIVTASGKDMTTRAKAAVEGGILYASLGSGFALIFR